MVGVQTSRVGGTYDPATDLFTVRGNQQNLHAGARPSSAT